MKLGTRKKRELGLMPDGFDYHYLELIEPEFYGILKEEGLPTSRKKNGDYWDKGSQRLWEIYKANKND